MSPGILEEKIQQFARRRHGLSSLQLRVPRFFPDNLAGTLIALVFGALLGVGLYHQALKPDFPDHHVTRLPLGQEVILSGRLFRPSRVNPESVRLYLALEAWKAPEGWRPAAGKLLVTAPPLTPPPVGTPLVVRGKLREPRVLKNPGALNRPRQLAAEGIFRQMHLNDPAQVIFLAAAKGPSLAERLRGGVRTILKGLHPDLEAFYLSMLLGDQGKVTPEMRRNLSLTGTSHLLVINGMHLGAVATVTFFLVFMVLRRFPWLLLRLNSLKIATVTAAVPVMGYAHLAGGSPSTQRAEIMVLSYLLLMFLGRYRDVWSALALAAFLILIWSPLLLFAVSFQLSFAAVAGILYLSPRLISWLKEEPALPPSGSGGRRWLNLGRRRLMELLVVSFSASLATSPLVAHHFQVVSLFGFLVNLAAIPLVLLLALPLGELAVLAQALTLTPLAEIFIHIGKYPLQWGYAVITWVAGLPGSGIMVPPPSWVQVGLMYALLGLVFLPRPSVLSRAGAALAGAVLVLTLTLPLLPIAPDGEVTVLDSNSGLDAVLVSPAGHRVAVTAAWEVWPGYEGGGLGALPGYLHWRQFRRLEAVLALNLNARNAPEMLTLAQQFDIRGFWWEGRRPEGKVIELINYLGDSGRPGLSLTKMNPPKNLGDMTLEYLDLAEVEMVALKATCRGRRILILPPLKRAAGASLSELKEESVEVLVAPGEMPPAVIERLKPATIILYGSKTLGAGKGDLSRPPIYRTRRGAVTVTVSDRGATCTQWRP
ncbi:MAG: ComEC/Rec2 family competence protein [Desulfobaccales bacterium]